MEQAPTLRFIRMGNLLPTTLDYMSVPRKCRHFERLGFLGFTCISERVMQLGFETNNNKELLPLQCCNYQRYWICTRLVLL